MEGTPDQGPGDRPSGSKLSIFDYDSAPYFFDTDMLTELGGSDAAVSAYEAAWADGQSNGSITKILFRQASDTGISVLHVWQKPGKVTPRHSHDSDCLYYVIAGELRLGNRSLGPGQGFFVPGGHPYNVTAGPHGAELLEIRPRATSFDMQLRDQSEEYWAGFAAGVRASQDDWNGADVPPSMRGARV
jgi:quercetin dioxygenase-like cupin family protein